MVMGDERLEKMTLEEINEQIGEIEAEAGSFAEFGALDPEEHEALRDYLGDLRGLVEGLRENASSEQRAELIGMVRVAMGDLEIAESRMLRCDSPIG